MATLDVRTLIGTIEATLLELLELGLQTRLPAVADLTALAAAGTETTRDRALRYVTAENRLYRWVAASTAAHSSPDVIRPATAPANGRWLRVNSVSTWGPNQNAPLQSRQAGYVRWVRLYQGLDTLDDMQVGVDGQTPAVLIHWVGDAPQARSQYQGALYWDVLEFRLQLLSSCLRPPSATTMGSPIAGELARDPGLHRLIGDCRYLLAGVVTNQIPGIESIEIGPAAIVDEDLEERLHAAELQILVRTAWTIPDEDLVDMDIQVDRKFPADVAEADTRPFDRLNYVAQGYRVQVGIGLTRSYGAGVAFIGGTTVSSTPADHTFTALRDTYRDLKPDGTFAYLEVEVGAKAPAVTTGALRVGLTRTDAANIVIDRIICSCAYQLDTVPMRIP